MVLYGIFLGELAILISGLFFIFISYKKNKKAQHLLAQAKTAVDISKKEVDSERKEALLRLKEELYKKRVDAELESQKERAEIDRLQKKALSRLEVAEKKERQVLELQQELQNKEKSLLRMADQLHLSEKKLKTMHEETTKKLEYLSCMTKEEAKSELFRSLESEVLIENQKWIQKEEEAAQRAAKERSIQIIVGAMQRYVADQVTPHSSGVVHLPNDDMKGRIIGKEGRNIKSLELATGMDFVIGDTPEIITISGFNPIRREIARRSLEKLILDGRINPTRIEETVSQCEREIEETIEEYGKKSSF